MLPYQVWSFCFKRCMRKSKETQKLGALDPAPLRWGRGWCWKYIPPQHMLPCQIWFVLGQTARTLLRSPSKFDLSRPAFQGHSRSSESARISLSEQWLPINVPYQSWAYLVQFPRQTAISVENSNFSHPVYLTPPLKGFPRNWVTLSGIKKLEWWFYQAKKEVWRYL